jgi:nitrite reductase/ring-hydroxylating ferredoxin subunit
MAKISIGMVTDMEDVPLQGFTIQGRLILLANLGGTYFAMGNVCSHDRCWLSEGRIIGGNVQCPCHGSMFSLKTGEAVHRPATDPVPVYDVTVENEEVFIDM